MSASSRPGATASIRLRPRSSIVTVGDRRRPTLFPTGAELVSAYLEPLAATPELAAVIETNARVTAISRHGVDKVVSRGRETRPFVLAVSIEGRRSPRSGARGDRRLGNMDDAKSARGERPAGRGRSRIRRSDRLRHSGYPRPRSSSLRGSKDARRRIGPLGRQCAARTCAARGKLTRARRSCGRREAPISREFISGGDADQLPARGELGANVRALVDSGRVKLRDGIRRCWRSARRTRASSSKARRPTACVGSGRSIGSSPPPGSGPTCR